MRRGSPMEDDTTHSSAKPLSNSGGGSLWLRWLAPEGVPDRRVDERSTLIVGRGVDADLSVPASKVSRQHARLTGKSDTIDVCDLDSSNGTWVNGVRVARASLSAGDLLRFGESLAILSATEPSERLLERAPGMFGGSELARTLETARRVAVTNLPVVVVGETGTGKELVARALHAWSERDGPLVTTNCATLPESLAESQLFGYRQGAFTGAGKGAIGLFEAARGGTLFLDEVAELPLATQAKLLRALEYGEVWPLGARSRLGRERDSVLCLQCSCPCGKRA